MGAKYQQVQLNASLTYTGTFAENITWNAMIGGEYYTYNQFDFEAKTQALLQMMCRH